jgi:MinD-like ATPase involved in chromosome partitioning or flagellar assembly
MSQGAGSRSPKTLADVSHLFFSVTGGRQGASHVDPAAGAGAGASVSSEDAGRPLGRDPGRWRRTRVVVVTGGYGAPGKSTIAINLAHALMQRGRVGIFDADPRIPNARFYLGFPSWHYLSPLTGEGKEAPTTLTDSGLVVADWSVGSGDPAQLLGVGDVVYVDIPDAGRHPLDYVVIDLAPSRIPWIRPVAPRVDQFILVARPEWDGFEEAFGVLSALGTELGAADVGVVVNRVRESGYATAFHDKLATAGERLLSLKTRLLGGVVFEPNLGSEQRERGAIVRARPDAVSALLLREIAANILGKEGTRSPREGGAVPAAGVEKSDEDTDRAVTAS